MKLVIGLGNPDAKYLNTRHNAGFMVLDELAGRLALKLSRKECFSLLGEKKATLYAKPQTYMNNSGRAVGAVLAYRKLSPAELLVVTDDADIPLGSLRLRKKGGTGGHRGLASISEVLGTSDYERVRVGIGRGITRDDLVDHVLGSFGREEWAVARDAVEMAADAVLASVEQGMDAAMNRFNTRPESRAGGNDVTAGGKKQ